MATFPLTQRLANKTYRYRICDTTFDIEDRRNPGRKNDWIALIIEAFDQWKAAASPLGLTFRRVLLPCTDYEPVIRLIESKVQELLMKDPALLPGDLIEGVRSYLVVERFLNNANGRLVAGKLAEDRRTNEIIMFNYPTGPSGYLYEQRVFPQISTDLGQEKNCWAPYQEFGQAYVEPDARMCTVLFEGMTVDGQRVVTTDIFIRRGAYSSFATLALPASDARANKYRNLDADLANSPYKDFIHEIGHALGIGGGAKKDAVGGKWDSRGHPQVSVRDTVMGTAPIPKCSPYPLDLMALYALYQTQ